MWLLEERPTVAKMNSHPLFVVSPYALSSTSAPRNPRVKAYFETLDLAVHEGESPCYAMLHHVVLGWAALPIFTNGDQISAFSLGKF